MFLKLLILLMIYIMKFFENEKILLRISGLKKKKKFVRKKAILGIIKILMFTKTW